MFLWRNRALSLKNRIKGLSADELLRNGVSYNKTCYNNLTHKTCIQRTKVRYEKGKMTGSSHDVKQKVKGQRQIKEERGLLQRCIVSSRSRTELDLRECIVTYDFGVVPRSLFAADGSLLLAYDKASLLHHLEKLTTTQCEQADRNRTIETDPSDNQAMGTPLQLANTVQEQTHMNIMEESLSHRVIIIDGKDVVN